MNPVPRIAAQSDFCFTYYNIILLTKQEVGENVQNNLKKALKNSQRVEIEKIIKKIVEPP